MGIRQYVERLPEASKRTSLVCWLLLAASLGYGEEVGGTNVDNPSPVFHSRSLYAPGHFGNSYEVMGEREMRDLLSEAKWWGFNRYGDWFDTIDCSDPFADKHFNLAGALWERKRANFRTAQSLGLDCDLIITPNHVYLDQCLPEVAAVKGKRIFGQLVCPSQSAGREIILRNYRNLFEDLEKAGVRLSGLSSCPYDYGGCACESCQPWILTFAELTRDIHKIAEEHHPGIEMHFVGWWWAEEEHRQFAEWVDREAPGWAKSIALHIPYGKTTVSDVVLPKGCERRAFVHIGYAEQASPRDTYGHLGPVAAASRIERTVEELSERGCTGVMAYSEGVFDDINKALLAGLSSGYLADGTAVLRAYAKRYLGADGDTEGEWAEWLRALGKPFSIDPVKAGQSFDKLIGNGPIEEWRVRQLQSKVDLLRLNSAIVKEASWTEERLARVEEFWAVRERLHREVWGLGPQRHILGRKFIPVPWYKEWAKRMIEKTGDLGDEM